VAALELKMEAWLWPEETYYIHSIKKYLNKGGCSGFMFLSIVIAIYNERENVRELTERIYYSMKELAIPFELIYVIDGTDGSFEILKQLKEERKTENLVLNHSEKLRGFRNAFVKGFSLANKKATHILTMDGDLNHQPEEIEKLVREMDSSSAKIVIGSRYTKKGKVEKIALWKRAVSVGSNAVIRIVWGIKIKDKTSGFRLYKKEAIDKIVPKCKSNNFEFLFEILINAIKMKYKIREVPITFKPRKGGESKFQLWKTSKGYLKLMMNHFLGN
jgi:dolichol-phosphate mannosyltransferase